MWMATGFSGSDFGARGRAALKRWWRVMPDRSASDGVTRRWCDRTRGGSGRATPGVVGRSPEKPRSGNDHACNSGKDQRRFFHGLADDGVLGRGVISSRLHQLADAAPLIAGESGGSGLEEGFGLDVACPHARPSSDLQNVPMRSGCQKPAEQEQESVDRDLSEALLCLSLRARTGDGLRRSPTLCRVLAVGDHSVSLAILRSPGLDSDQYADRFAGVAEAACLRKENADVSFYA